MNPKGRDLVDAAGVQKKFGVTRPGSMRDLQALMGDAAVSSVPLSMLMWCCVNRLLRY
jgi:hypothetical protein